jgi:ubiquinone/menaquinone biosynthesis C-methylase UbiE
MSQATMEIWGKIAEARQEARIDGWLDSPLIQNLYVQPLTGMVFTSGEHVWLKKLIDQFEISPHSCWLSIGCGNGGWELYIAESGFCEQIEGIDISPHAIRIAQEAANSRAISKAHFRASDIQAERLPEESYDVVLFSMSLHHVERLEYVLAEVLRSLRPGGYLIINEYVGPSRWQWDDQRLTIINTLLAALPPHYRVHSQRDEIKSVEERPSIEFMKHIDPSESVRSADILPVLKRYFEVAAEYPYGGAILHKLLEYIVGNFNPNRAEDIELLLMLCSFEQALVHAGIVENDFMALVARKRKAAVRPSWLDFEQIDAQIVTGVYPVEESEQQRRFCWTSAHAQFVLERPAQARLLAIQLLLPPVARTLTIKIDDQVVSCLRSKESAQLGKWQELFVYLPPISEQEPTISFELDSAWSAQEVFQHDDSRELGIALRDLRFL